MPVSTNNATKATMNNHNVLVTEAATISPPPAIIEAKVIVVTNAPP